MQFEKVQCLVTLNQGGNVNLAAVAMAGPSALAAPEIPILRARHEVGDGGYTVPCISDALVVGSVEQTQASMLDSLRRKYGSAIVNTIYPGGRGLPRTLDDCELPSSSLAKKRAAKATE